MSKKLNEQMRLFCRELIQHPEDQKGAAVRAFYSAKTAGEQASRLLRNVAVQKELNRLRKNAEEKAEWNAADILKEIARVAFLDPAGAFNKDGSLKPIHEMPEDVRRAVAGVDVVEMAGGMQINLKPGKAAKPGEQLKTEGELKHVAMYTKKIRFVSKMDALQLAGRHFKMFTDKMQIENVDELAERLQAARKRAHA